MSAGRRLTPQHLTARAEALEECAGHLDQNWTDDSTEREEGNQLAARLLGEARWWRECAARFSGWPEDAPTGAEAGRQPWASREALRRTWSAEALTLYREIGEGMRLLLHPKNGLARLVKHPRFDSFGHREREVDRHIVDELLRSGWLRELPEHETDHVVGWRESGLPGEEFHVYACLQ